MDEQNIFIRINSGIHTAGVGDLEVTSDGSYVVTGSGDKTVRVWDPIAQKEVRQFIGRIGDGEKGRVTGICLSPDDRYLLTVVRWDNDPKHLGPHLVRVYDFVSGAMVHTFHQQGRGGNMDFTANGENLLITDFHYGKIELYDFKHFRAHGFFKDPAVIQCPPNLDPMQAKFCEFEGDLRIVAMMWRHNDTVDPNSAIGLYSLAHGWLSNHISTGIALPGFIDVSDQHIAVSINHGTTHKIIVFDHDASPDSIRYIEGIAPAAVKFSPDGRRLLAGFEGFNDYCTVYSVQENFGSQISQFTLHGSTVRATAFLNNHTAVTCGGAGNEIYFWDPADGQIRGEIHGVGQSNYGVGINKGSVAYGNTQSFVAHGNNLAPIEKAISLDSFQMTLLTQRANQDDVVDFKRVNSTDSTGQQLFLDPGSGNLYCSGAPLTGIQKAGKDGNRLAWNWFGSAVFGFTEQDVVLAGDNRDGHVYAVAPHGVGIYLARFVGHVGAVWDLAVEGNRLVTCGADQTIRLWNLDEVPPATPENLQSYQNYHAGETPLIKPMLTLFVTKSGEWIVWSPSGYYNSSQNGDQFVGFHVNNDEGEVADFFPAAQFMHVLYRPDVVSKIIELGSEKGALDALGLSDINIAEVLPPTIELQGELPVVTTEATLNLSFKVAVPEGQMLTRVWVLNNELPVETWDEKALDDGLFQIDEFYLNPGPNEIKIFAKTAVSQTIPTQISVMRNVDEGTRAIGRRRKKPVGVTESKPNLYLLSVGVSKYKNGGKDGLTQLQYADRDATEIVKLFESQAGHLFGEVHTTLLVNEKGTRKGILNGIKAIDKKITKRTTEKQNKDIVARDVMLIFLAGHGYKKDNEYYFLTHETDLKKRFSPRMTTSLYVQSLGNIVNKLPTEIILFADTCHAGAAGGSFNTDEFTKKWAAISDRAQVIFNATTADFVSYEHRKWGEHGAFTKGLLDTLQRSGDKTLLELLPQVSQEVRSMTKDESQGMQRPSLTVHGVLIDFPIYS